MFVAPLLLLLLRSFWCFFSSLAQNEMRYNAKWLEFRAVWWARRKNISFMFLHVWLQNKKAIKYFFFFLLLICFITFSCLWFNINWNLCVIVWSPALLCMQIFIYVPLRIGLWVGAWEKPRLDWVHNCLSLTQTHLFILPMTFLRSSSLYINNSTEPSNANA